MSHKAKKSLGQHFLRSNSALRAIVESGKVTSSDTVLEIGPGEGVLTDALLKTGAKVLAVEMDKDLIPILNDKFKNELASGQLQIIEGDVLKFHPEFHGLKMGEYKLVANIPYYITGAIFEKFLTTECYPSTIVVLIQKEVATRIVARDGKESILSISVKAFGKPKITAKVPASAFRPAPKVDSAVLLVEEVSHKNLAGFSKNNFKSFFDVVKSGFAHKRKLLSRNLEVVAPKNKVSEVYESIGLPQNTRAEDVSLSNWIELAKRL